MKIPNGPVACGSALGTRWGLTPDRWWADSYLWVKGRTVTCSLMLAAKLGGGAFGDLVRKIQADGFKVVVPTPSAQMREILTKWGANWAWDGGCEIAVLPVLPARKVAA